MADGYTADKIGRSAQRHNVAWHESMCNALIICFSKARMQHKAEEQYAILKESGIIGSSHMYTCLVACCLRTKNLNKALIVLRDSIAAGIQVSKYVGIRIKVENYNS